MPTAGSGASRLLQEKIALLKSLGSRHAVEPEVFHRDVGIDVVAGELVVGVAVRDEYFGRRPLPAKWLFSVSIDPKQR